MILSRNAESSKKHIFNVVIAEDDEWLELRIIDD